MKRFPSLSTRMYPAPRATLIGMTTGANSGTTMPPNPASGLFMCQSAAPTCCAMRMPSPVLPGDPWQ